jgi:polyisoprenoid-binding protein YceI
MVEGAFHEVSGVARFDPDHPSSTAAGVARIAVASIDTGDAELDRTHRGPDVFDAETYPDIVLKATSITPAGRGRFRMTGDVTIRDLTRPVTFDVDYGGVRTDRRGGRRATMTMTGSVDCADFGLVRSIIFQRLVGTRVEVRIEAELLETSGGEMVA